jgi:hypothetical protein
VLDELHVSQPVSKRPPFLQRMSLFLAHRVISLRRDNLSAFRGEADMSRWSRSAASVVNDAVNGATSAASECYSVVALKRKKIQGGEAARQRQRRQGKKFEGIGEDRRRNANKVVAGIGRTRLGHRTLKCVRTIGTRSAQSIMASGHTGRTNRPDT